MIPIITAFEQSPDRGQGLARDMPVRWAFEEVDQPYDVHLVSFSAMKETAHRAFQPFGQIPTYQEDNLVLFESGAKLGNQEWLDGSFSAGDLLMVQVLRRLNGSQILDEFPNLAAYVARGEARPAFMRAFEAQLAVFQQQVSEG